VTGILLFWGVSVVTKGDPMRISRTVMRHTETIVPHGVSVVTGMEDSPWCPHISLAQRWV